MSHTSSLCGRLEGGQSISSWHFEESSPACRAMTTVIIGTGTWGTAAAAIIAGNGHDTVLWGRDAVKVGEMARTRMQPELRGYHLPENLRFSADNQALAEATLILWAVPTQHTRTLAQQVAPYIGSKVAVISLAKGLEQGSLQRVTEVLGEIWGPRSYACLSGPAMAQEVVAGKPVALVVAGEDAVCQRMAELFRTPRTRVYTSTDVVGVELGGALKNVIAIAAGLCEGLGLGDNAKAALIVRGLAEMRRLGRKLGASDSTFAGLAGIGDLLTSCYSPLGRNHKLGVAIAQGAKPQDLLAQARTVAEGAWTCRAAVELGARCGVELPIAFQVASVIWSDTHVATALDNLLARAPKEEEA